MSKVREQLKLDAGELSFGPEGDLRPFVIFTQLKKDGPYIYAGWVDAADGNMAMWFGREHYGQDQQCISIWAIPREFIGGLRMNVEAAREAVPERAYQLFTQRESGDQHVSGPRVRATSAAEALTQAAHVIDDHGTLHNVWAVPVDEILETNEGDLIWRHTDQTYRLARGYAKDVREKWEAIREERALQDYEKDDLKDTF